MRLTLRTKLLAIVAIAGAAFTAVIVVSSLLSERVEHELTRMRQVYLPLVALGPKVENLFEHLSRAFQDSVAAHDLDALAATRGLADELLGEVAAGGEAVEPAKAEAARAAVQAYWEVAADVSRRLIAGETGEALVGAMSTMQARQRAAAEALRAATTLERQALADAFTAVADTQATANDLRLVVSLACLAGVVLLSLGFARGVLRSLGRLDAGLERFGGGDFSVAVPVVGDDELAHVASRANRMAQSLERLAAEREKSAWIDAGQAGLARALRGEMTPEEVAARALAFLTSYLAAPVAALYQSDAQGGLHLRAVHGAGAAAGSATALQPSFARGEGLVGQAALGDELVVIAAPPAGYLRVRSALGEAAPTTLVLLPLTRGGSVIGVVELGLFKPWTELERALLLGARESLAIALDVARANAETRALLAETQALARRLSDQDEKLHAANAELQAQQEELRHQNAELSRQAEELETQRRALADRNAALDETRKLLERKNDELATVSAYKSQFLTNMSHELRTPLNSMLLLSNLLAENDGRNLSDKQVEFCRTIYSAGKDLLALINQVLDLAKVEAGKQEIRLGPMRLEDVATRARRVFEPLAHEKGLSLVVEVAPDLPAQIRSDQQRVDQILTNLLGNAVKFSTSGTVALRIRRPGAETRFQRPELRAEGTIALAVSDTGPGIAPRDRERIFAPFEQLDAKSDRRYGGTGLGLGLARELATLLGGEIQLDSTPGIGSTFVCYLPDRADAQLAPVRPPTFIDDDRQALAPDEPHLLVIEDDPAFAHTFGEVIHGHGLKYVVAATAEEGLRLARAGRPSGIILDVRLPDSDGFALMGRLQSDPATATIPVHFVSAVDAAEHGLSLGAIGYLVKPAVRRDLVRVIESLAPTAAARARRILVVEDDVATGDSLLKMLAAESLEAERVTSAAAALQALEQGFGCMILDLALPDMDGLHLLERVRAARGADMPSVVVYTARALSGDEARRLEAYTEAIVIKEGSSAERVVDEIRRFVRRLKEGLSPRRPIARLPSGEVDLSGRQALVVDDDMRTVYALSAALRAKGVDVFVAENGRAALDALELRPGIDIVLMDIMMPEMDGYEAMRRIRADARFGALPIIALTAKAMKGDEQKCLQAGANAYLPKPIDAARLLGLIHAQLAARDAAPLRAASA
ncbi:MAG: response regulator [Myxococcota bacterium]